MSCLEAVTQHSVFLSPTTPGIQTAFSPLRVGVSLLQMVVRQDESESRSVVSDSLRPHGLYTSWNSPGQNTGVGSLCLLQGIFPNQGSSPHFLHCRQILYQLSYQGSP